MADDNDTTRFGTTNFSNNTGTTISATTRDFTGRTTVAGLFQDREQARQAIGDLKAAGFGDDAIGIAARDRNDQNELIEDTGTHASDGAAKGAVSGGILGGLVGLLVGLGALAIPGIGPVVAGGVLAHTFGIAAGTTIAGAGIGVVGGGLLGALTGLGIPENEARHFETGFHAGGTLVTVNAGSRSQEAIDILERGGGDTGASTYNAAEYNTTGATDYAAAPSAFVGAGDDNRAPLSADAPNASTDVDNTPRQTLGYADTTQRASTAIGSEVDADEVDDVRSTVR